MKTALGTAALLAALGQESDRETAADLDKRARELLQTKVVVLKDLTLPLLFFMTRELDDINCYVDPVAVPRIDEVTIPFDGEAALEDVLLKTLKKRGLLHFVWQGVVVITDDKGRKVFEDGDWPGPASKALRDHPELSRKLDTAFTFKWNALEPRLALKAFAEISGVAIDGEAIEGLKFEKVEKRGLLSPRRTTLRGALGCLARTTGITCEISKSGGWVVLPPPKK